MQARPSLHNIQILRGVAAMLVVFHHAVGQMERRGGRELGLDASFGQAGVDLFFVISGFIMVYVTRSGIHTPLEFWRDRILRIVPLYWIYTLLMVAIVLAAPGLLKTATFDPLHVLKSLFFIPAWHPHIESLAWPLLVQGWTLNYEMFFYLIFGLVVVVRAPSLRLILLGAVLVGLVALGWWVRPHGPIGQSYTNPLLLEFLAGAVIAHAHGKGQLPARNGAWACLGAGIVLMGLAIAQPGWSGERVVAWGLPCVFIVIGALGLENGRPGPRVLQLLGDASYSTYLNHTFTLGVIGVIWARLGDGSLLFDAVLFCLALLASAAVGIASFWLIERPVARRLKKVLAG